MSLEVGRRLHVYEVPGHKGIPANGVVDNIAKSAIHPSGYRTTMNYTKWNLQKDWQMDHDEMEGL